jgi:hypothetical protein
MSYRIVAHAERPALDGTWDEVVGPAWPEFLYHDAVCNLLWPRLYDEFADFQFYLLDEEADRVVGQGNSAPFAWDGDPTTLPDGVNGVLPLAVEQREGWGGADDALRPPGRGRSAHAGTRALS